MQIRFECDSQEAKAVLAQDPTLAPIFEKTRAVVFSLDQDLFMSLASTIIYQQLSGKVAAIIFQRLLDFFGGSITAEKLLASGIEELRSLGVSFRKIEYLKSLAQETENGTVDLNRIDTLADQEVIEMLIRIKGIGRWSAEMFLLFCLGRRNVFSSLDLGLRKALEKLYGRPISIDEASQLCEKWAPYKSIVTHFLWHFLEDKKA